ncbi:oligosaccharide translocation protein RFT1 [Magnaporthiopsis poae ATCC 64411]|uniref:Man(5)GlcNAc(2)-PP-dolichol translocation protein RFT1 n=1 Tax=Magnaporthiopsis poae (strain ATCC 64411 / 73-15) TaxID=644358 RepID=A0A0C4DST2_MAGP6|nr:oligosaccharide translocation protein RFT1 [Magnaporthiopsis poae ATCC 64411]
MGSEKEANPLGSPAASGALRGASLLILLQVVSRAITFIANQLLLRFLTAQLLGVSTQLEVYYLSVLFFARESLRVAIQRQGDAQDADARGDDGKAGTAKADATTAPTTTTTGPQPPVVTDAGSARTTQAVVNLSYISILLGLVSAALLGILYLGSVDRETVASTPFLLPSFSIYAVAAMVELLSEPAFVVMQTRLQFGARATAESTATFARCIITLGSAVAASRLRIEAGVLPFALGQLSYGLVLLAVYGWYGMALAGKEGFSLLPKKLATSSPASSPYAMSFFYRPTLYLARSMIAQSLFKHLLTQGDTLLVTALSTPTAQGVYALANNYGGLVARLVFQPIEESSRSYFSRLLSQSQHGPSVVTDKSTGKDEQEQDKDKAAARKASADLTVLLKLYSIFSVVVVALGPTAAPLLAEVRLQSAWMGAFSLAFGAAGFVFLRVLNWGARGLVVANSINMACRIIWCAGFISRYFARAGVTFDLAEVRPSALTIGAAAVANQVVRGVVGGSSLPSLAAKQIIIELVKVAGVAIVFIVLV